MCVHARIPLSRSASTFGKLVPRPSPLTFILSQGPTTRKQRKLRALALSYLGTLAPFPPSPPSSQFPRPSPTTNPTTSFVPSVLPPPVSLFHSTNGPLSLSLSLVLSHPRPSPLLPPRCSSLVDLLPSHRRVSRKSPWLGPPLDKISLIRSRSSKVFLPLSPPLLETRVSWEIF